ncbi:hypothetical protein [Clostridium senegalense]|uniref:hypothetical protein n=1 Tax=Clostridium senegalense TaxID=1465809 RepID=UPI0002893A30|nr:hypothetical protein [Clostridium senegalense]
MEKNSLKIKKKWIQLKKREQIKVSTMLRERYINFIVEHKRKPNREERKFIASKVYLETEEMKLEISDNEICKYFESKISKYDKSVEKMEIY